MEIELGPFQKYDSVKNNAFWSRIGIDTRLKIDDFNIEDYLAHLRDCENNPTVGLLARKKYITGTPMNHPEAANRNLCYLQKQPEVDSLQKSIDNKIQTLYPKTKKIREYIIDNERVVLDRIKQIKKYTVIDKLIIAFKKIV